MKRTAIVKKLDKVFSTFIRLSHADHAGNIICFTCGASKNWKYQTDAGHYQVRGKYSTRWSEENVKPQCKRCNGFLEGEQKKFGEALDALYGEGAANRIEFESNQMRKFTNEELLQKIEHYKKKVNDLT